MSRFFINRPIVAMVIAIVTVIGGFIAMRGLPLAQFPEIVPPQIVVSTTYTGADAVTIEQSVSTPLEQQMNGVDNMLYMQSTNANDGTEQLTVTFGVETDANIDQVNVQNRVALALAALLLRPRKASRGLLARFFGGFNRVFTKATHGYVNWSHALIRKAVVGMLILAGFAVVDGLISRKLPTSFLPEEDYGYALLNVQLPAAASLARTDQVLKKVEGILGKTEGVQDYTTVGGFSLLTRVSASYQGFFFINLKPWHERTAKPLEARAIVDSLNRALAVQVPEAVAFAFMPPSIPGLGNAGGFSFWLQDRSGGSVEFLDQNLQKFLAACRQRPELAGVASQFSAAVPQIYADVDRDKLMTSFAFILGCVPLWVAAGSGAAGRRILGTVVIVGMLAATSIAIFLIPVSFYVVEKFLGRGKAPVPAAELQPLASEGGD